MAEGFLKSFDPALEVYSAGTNAEKKVNPFAVKVMSEIGIDISMQYPKQVVEFLHTGFDYVITVCDKAKEACPYFSGKVVHRMHIGFEDPADAQGNEEEVMAVYRKVRDKIKTEFKQFLKTINNE
jgi:arsenate reductase